MSNLRITNKTQSLQRAKGYWSNREIYVNRTPDLIVVEQPCSIDGLNQEIKKLQERLVTTDTFNKYFLRWLDKNYLGSFKINEILSDLDSTWPEFQKYLRAEKQNKNQISKICAEHWRTKYSQQPSRGIENKKLSLLPLPLSPLLIDAETITAKDPETYILNFSKLSQIVTHSKANNLTPLNQTASQKRLAFLQNLTTEERALIEWALPMVNQHTDQSQYYYSALTIIHAAQIAITWLRSNNILILPNNFIKQDKFLIDFAAWPQKQLATKTAEPVVKKGLLKLIASTNTKSAEDLPENLFNLLGNDFFPSGFYQALATWLGHPEMRAKKAPFPVDELLPSNNRVQQTRAWTPKWVKEQYEVEWYDFATLWWLHEASDQHKTGALRTFLSWACNQRNFKSPWEISVIDLRNAHRPTYTGTFYHYLKDTDIQDKSGSWSLCATLFRVVCQYGKMPDSPMLIHGKLENPFQSLNNPFSKRRSQKNKTHRSSIPSAVHELMIETLLSPDENGRPTFSWAKQLLTNSNKDFTNVIDPNNPSKQLTTWCPSRATCLAILLLTPLRTAQARWLDQGLMDNECYDFSTKGMTPNTHSLKEFYYPNGNTHLQQYGRSSGVLQLSSDILTRERSLSIYVNTNKTQLWDGQRKSGYEMSWPDGSELLLSESPEQRAKGKWLARLYRVIEYQQCWMSLYDPAPYPVSFFHSKEDNQRTTTNDTVHDSLPWFVPLFRDININKLVSYELHGKVVQGYCPISRAKLASLYNQLALETEKRWHIINNQKIYLTQQNEKTGQISSKFDLHSLRVTWVSRLFEMGVPVHIISEYIVGHATHLMTCLYLKIQPAFVRETLIKAAQENDHNSSFEALLKHEHNSENPQNYLVGNRGENVVDLLPDNFTTFVSVEGGLCPMGGKGSSCSEGAIAAKDNVQTLGNVQGGCGNCRFFLTGPDFTIEQLFACNHVMLKMRVLGKEQKLIYNQLDDVNWQIEELPADDKNKKNQFERQRQLYTDRIEQYNEQMLPLIYEWFNRHELLQLSDKLREEQKLQGSSQFMLVGSHELTIDDYSIESQDTSEFELLRAFIEQARIIPRQGYSLPEEPSRMLREFMAIILDQSSCENLLYRIPDTVYATHVASAMAGWISDEFKEGEIQACIDNRQPLPLRKIQNEQLQEFMKKAYDNYLHGNRSISNLLSSQRQQKVKK